MNEETSNVVTDTTQTQVEEKLFTQSELDTVVRKVKLKTEIQQEMGRDNFLKENGFNTVDEFTEFKTNYDNVKTENEGLITKAENAEIRGVFQKHNIQEESMMNKMSKLADLETEGTKVERIEKAIGEFSELFTTKPVVKTETVVEQNTKQASGNPTPSPKNINGQSIADFYKDRYKDYYKK